MSTSPGRLIDAGPWAGWTHYADGGLLTHPSGRRIRTRGRGFECSDCSVNTEEIDETFMLTDDLWARVVATEPPVRPNAGGVVVLCVGCIEHRIGRELQPPDFKTVPLSDPTLNAMSPRLLTRIGASA